MEKRLGFIARSSIRNFEKNILKVNGYGPEVLLEFVNLPKPRIANPEECRVKISKQNFETEPDSLQIWSIIDKYLIR